MPTNYFNTIDNVYFCNFFKAGPFRQLKLIENLKNSRLKYSFNNLHLFNPSQFHPGFRRLGPRHSASQNVAGEPGPIKRDAKRQATLQQGDCAGSD